MRPVLLCFPSNIKTRQIITVKATTAGPSPSVHQVEFIKYGKLSERKKKNSLTAIEYAVHIEKESYYL